MDWLDAFVSQTGHYIHTNPWLALVAVFLGGLLIIFVGMYFAYRGVS